MAVSRTDFESLAIGKVETFHSETLGVSVDMRHPLFSEWHALCMELRALPEGQPPSAELMIRTVAAVLVNPDGTRMFAPGDIGSLDTMAPAPLFELYNLAWKGPMRGLEATDEAKKD